MTEGYCKNFAEKIYYVYNCKLSDLLSPLTLREGTAGTFVIGCALCPLFPQFRGWTKYKDKYVNWIIKQRNGEGFWELPRKPDLFNFPLV